MSKHPTPEDLVAIMPEVMAGYERFAFTYQGAEDIRQRAWVLAIEALDRYEPEKGPLLNFLRVNVRNRLLNDKRNKYVRADSPCKTCPLNAFVNNVCVAYEDPELECEWFGPWNERNQSRFNIAHPIALANVCWDSERALVVCEQPSDSVEWAEIWQILEQDIPEDIEALYWAWKTGFERADSQRRKRLSASEIERVQEYVRGRVGDIFSG